MSKMYEKKSEKKGSKNNVRDGMEQVMKEW